MRLLIDTDIFCKLGVSSLFDAVLLGLGISAGDCARLPALPHMLRRGKLPKLYGQAACDALLPFAQSIPAAPDPSAAWLEPLVSSPNIDPGEAQLLALTAERDVLLATGDKRALRAVAALPSFPAALSGKVVTLEALLLMLLSQMGEAPLRAALAPLGTDQLVNICFSTSNANVREGLVSYFGALATELHPLRLWEQGGAA